VYEADLAYDDTASADAVLEPSGDVFNYGCIEAGAGEVGRVFRGALRCTGGQRSAGANAVGIVVVEGAGMAYRRTWSIKDRGSDCSSRAVIGAEIVGAAATDTGV
jgi:hypothetical protein